MNGNAQSRRLGRAKWYLGLVGTVSLLWLLLRSGLRPHRLAYPCQRAALANACGFLGYVLPFLGSMRLRRRIKRAITPAGAFLMIALALVPLGLRGSRASASTPLYAKSALPDWTSPSAVSDVFAVSDVPIPKCSLEGGSLPGEPPCNDPEYALHDEGVDALVNLMEFEGTFFYQTALHPDGIVGPDDVVVIKVNNQWGGLGSGDGVGRLATNTDVLKGLIWRILEHPGDFAGEVVVAENTQAVGRDWDVTPANAQDPNQSILDVVEAFISLGYPVSLYDWTGLNPVRIPGGSIAEAGYPSGEYIHGNTRDAYILLEDPAGTGTNELSYPKFQTAQGTYLSMRYGVWNGSGYQPDRLTFINLPVLKRHIFAGATSAWKNLIGYITCDGSPWRYGTNAEMHDFFFGYLGGANGTYGLLGREIALIRAPELHVVDAVWVAHESNYKGSAVRQDILLASTDPFAVDWYASEYVLRPLTGSQDSSAALSGAFRDATRVNQDSAKLVWPGGSTSYPYIDLLDIYDGSTPALHEVEQMNVYVTTPGMPSLTLVSPNGGEEWLADSPYPIEWSWTGVITDVNLSYSTDGFATISHTIALSTPNSGVYTWTTPSSPLNSVRVRVADAINPHVYDQSDADLSIVEATHFSYLPMVPNTLP